MLINDQQIGAMQVYDFGISYVLYIIYIVQYILYNLLYSLYYIIKIHSVCMQYRNLQIRDIVDQTPRHRIRSCYRSNTETPAQIILPCAIWHIVAASYHTKTIKPSVETVSLPPADVSAPCKLQKLRD